MIITIGNITISNEPVVSREIYQTDVFTEYTTSEKILEKIYTGFTMQTGDMIAITMETPVGESYQLGSIYDSGNGGRRAKAGYLTGDTLVSSWVSSPDWKLQMRHRYFA